MLGQFSDAGAAGTPGITQHLPVINACFAGDDMAGILNRLQTEGGEWGQAVARELAHKSPTSMVVALRQMRVGGNLSFEDCMTTEFRVATRIVRSHDFAEGIRSVLVDKDHSPKWSPERVQDVDPATIDALLRRWASAISLLPKILPAARFQARGRLDFGARVEMIAYWPQHRRRIAGTRSVRHAARLACVSLDGMARPARSPFSTRRAMPRTLCDSRIWRPFV
ncbi:enoyl-CoA hydratase/isomerase family protein [Tistrella bauzanensis]